MQAIHKTLKNNIQLQKKEGINKYNRFNKNKPGYKHKSTKTGL